MDDIQLKPHQQAICLTYAANCKLWGKLPTMDQTAKILPFKSSSDEVRDYLTTLARSSDPIAIAQGVIDQLTAIGEDREAIDSIAKII